MDIRINIDVDDNERIDALIDFLQRIKKDQKPAIPDYELKDMLDLDVRTTNALRAEGITTVDELLERSHWQLKGIPNLGKKSLAKIINGMDNLGLSFTKRN